MPIIEKKGKGGVCGKATKGAPTEGASTPCKGKSTGRRKKVEESRGGGGGMCDQAMRSAARIEKELNRGAEKESRRALRQRGARRSTVTRIGVVHPGNDSNL